MTITATAAPPPSGTNGQFVGDVIARWLEDGRVMELQQDFAYVDPTARQWDAPKGSRVDGASIPRSLWSAFGGPFEGRYRNASVVHDVACDERTALWQDVHRMFFDAMLCGGVGRRKALAMYGAVYHFGPRWDAPAGTLFGRLIDRMSRSVMKTLVGVTRPAMAPIPGEALLEWLDAEIEASGIDSPEAVEAIVSDRGALRFPRTF